MSLMRLLSAGRTWMGSGSSQGRYRVDAKYKLPTFGAAKNPFARPETKPAQSELPITAPELPKREEVLLKPAVAETPKRTLTDVETRAANLKETQEMPKPMAVQPAPVAPVVTTAPVAPVATVVQATPATPTQVVAEREHVVLRFLDWLEVAAIWCKTHVMSFKFKKPSMPKLPSMAKLNPAKWIPKRKAQAVAVVASPQSGPVQAELSLEKVRVVRNDLSDADLEIVPMKPVTPKPARREKPQPEKQKVETPAELAGVEA